jgi:hypothetical protein
MAHFIYPQATSTTAFVLDSVIVSPTIDSVVPANNKGMPVVTLAGEGLGPLAVNTGAAGTTTLRVVLSSDSTISIEEDKNYGVVGANTIRTAAQIGNATGAAEFGSGADSVQTLRVTTSTRSETATTPLAVRLTDGTVFYAGATEITASAINTKLPASLGTKTKAGSLAVTLASDETPLPVTQSGTWNITNITGTVSLPTGAATEVTSLAISGKLPTVLGQTGMAGSLSVTIANDQSAIPASQSGTWNINNVSGTISLPTGAATETTLSALNNKVANDYGVSTAAIRTSAQIGNASGVADFNTGATSAQTLRVTLANDSRPASGFTPIQVINRDYSSSSISGTFATLGSTLSAIANCVTFFETGGSPIIIGWGGVDKFVIPPGGAESPVFVTIPSATQLQIRTADATTVTTGRFLMTVLG